MRLFIALEMDDRSRQVLSEMQTAMREKGISGQYMAPGNYHLTLAFIGQMESPEPVQSVMETIPFPGAQLEGLVPGNFGRIWYARPGISRDLEAYVRNLRDRLSSEGIPFDPKPFVPHITLLKKAVCPNGETPDMFPAMPLSYRTEEVSLMRSDRGEQGMVYTRVMAFPTH